MEIFSTMFNFLIISAASSPGVYYAYENSDGVGKAIVLILLICSVITWSVMLDKALGLQKAKRCSRRFLYDFHNATGAITAASLVRDGASTPGPLAQIYTSGIERLLEFYENDPANSYGVTQPVRLTEEQYNAIEAVLEQEVSSQIMELETRLGLLGTLVSLSPFCGLFGTVWGVMMGFCGIAAAGKSDFAALAPGVAGALLTTVAGLLVAIPSLVGYNYLNGTIRNMTVEMDNFVEEFMVRLRLEQLKLPKNGGEQ